MKYFGGKWRMADWIISHLPPHKIYVEPFCGAASVYLRKPPAKINVLNDIDQRIVSLFRVLRCPKSAARLEDLLRLTPYSRYEFKSCFEISSDPIEDARRMIVRMNQGFGSSGIDHEKTGWAMDVDNAKCKASTFNSLNQCIKSWHLKIKKAHIECDDFMSIIEKYDRSCTLFYIDPPYLTTTRLDGKYDHEIGDDRHVELLEKITSIDGMVVISGYESSDYDSILGGWRKKISTTRSMGNEPKNEIIWLSPNCPDPAPDLFSVLG